MDFGSNGAPSGPLTGLAGATTAHAPAREPTTVLVAVASSQVREGLVAMIGAIDGLRVVAEAATDEQAIDLARATRPRLALVDQELPGCGCWTIKRLRGERLAGCVVAIGRRADPVAARAAGAATYVQVGAPPEDVLAAVLEALAPAEDVAAAT